MFSVSCYDVRRNEDIFKQRAQPVSCTGSKAPLMASLGIANCGGVLTSTVTYHAAVVTLF